MALNEGGSCRTLLKGTEPGDIDNGFLRHEGTRSTHFSRESVAYPIAAHYHSWEEYRPF